MHVELLLEGANVVVDERLVLGEMEEPLEGLVALAVAVRQLRKTGTAFGNRALKTSRLSIYFDYQGAHMHNKGIGELRPEYLTGVSALIEEKKTLFQHRKLDRRLTEDYTSMSG